MGKEYEEPPSISQLIGINNKLGKKNRELQAELVLRKKSDELFTTKIVPDLKAEVEKYKRVAKFIAAFHTDSFKTLDDVVDASGESK